MSDLKVVIIGGGAAGFFGAIQIAENEPNANVVILESSERLLKKVSISGGGRCNVTHACFDRTELAGFYPRGHKELLQVFSRFSAEDMVKWLSERGVHLKTEDDGRMFPGSNTSATIVNCFLEHADRLNIEIECNCKVTSIEKKGQFILSTDRGRQIHADKVLIAIGGNPSASFYGMFEKMGHGLQKPVPSLFTFNISSKKLHALSGISVPDSILEVPELKIKEAGPLLITHWGFSGPAILKLSASGARSLNDAAYRFTLRVNWLGEHGKGKSEEILDRIKRGGATLLKNVFPEFPSRLRDFLLERAGINTLKRCADFSKRDAEQLKKVLLGDEFKVDGKTTFKEEFVTCGGIPLNEVNMKTMESKRVPGLYFAGEVLDIDGYTGGFNFQAAWSTSFIAASSIIASKTVSL